MRSLRILKICNLVFDQLIIDFYQRNPWVRSLSYEEHKKRLIEFAPVHLNGFSNYMKAQGHECDEFIFDLHTLQHQWAKENDATVSNHMWQFSILMQQIEKYRPDVIYMQDQGGLPEFARRRIKDWLPYVKKVVMFKGFPGPPNEINDLDMVFTGIPSIDENYRNAGIPTHLTYHSFDPHVTKYLEYSYKLNTDKIHPFSFIGYSGYGGHGILHIERYQALKRLLEESDLRVWTTELLHDKNPAHASDVQPLKAIRPNQCALSRFGLEMHKIISDSKVVFNRHTEALQNEVGNMRMFETTGIGSCLLTDSGANMADLFEPDREVVTYSNIDECLEKATYLIEHDREREKIAKAGHERCLRDHSLESRCAVISEKLQSLFD